MLFFFLSMCLFFFEPMHPKKSLNMSLKTRNKTRIQQNSNKTTSRYSYRLISLSPIYYHFNTFFCREWIRNRVCYCDTVIVKFRKKHLLILHVSEIIVNILDIMHDILWWVSVLKWKAGVFELFAFAASHRTGLLPFTIRLLSSLY